MTASGKCCASTSCQVAWLLGDHCYSVACYGKCITVKKPSSRIRSQLTLLTRKSQNPGNDSKLLTEVVILFLLFLSCCRCCSLCLQCIVGGIILLSCPFTFSFTSESSTATFAFMDAFWLSHSSLSFSVFIFTERQGIPGSRQDHGKFNIKVYVTDFFFYLLD